MESTNDSELCCQAKKEEQDHLCVICSKLSTNEEEESNSTSSSIVNVNDKRDELIHFNPDDINGKEIAIENLEHCEIFAKGIPSSVHIRNLHSCVIIVGPCSRTVDIDECHQCEFAIACQQLRVHTSDECDFYVHITAKPVIEDCHRCRFAPYNVEYQSKQKDIAQSGLVWTIDCWNDVLDFNHKLPNVHSPNWETIEEEERKGWSLDLSSLSS